MLTLKGSILGLAILFVGAVLVGSLKIFKFHSGPQVGYDLVSMWHNQAVWRLPFFWVTVIVFMTIGSWLVRLFWGAH